MTAAPALWSVAAQTPDSLIVNGDFEEGPPVSAFLNIAVGVDTIAGWVVTGEGIDYVESGYYHASKGSRSLDLDGSRRSRTTPPYVQGGIAQTFPTTPGQRYTVTFDLAGNPYRPPAEKPMRVSAAGESMDFEFDITGKTGPNMGWLSKTFTFTAKESSTTLEFRSLTESPLTGYGAAIDNVVVTTAPAGSAVEVRETDEELEAGRPPEEGAGSGGKARREPAEEPDEPDEEGSFEGGAGELGQQVEARMRDRSGIHGSLRRLDWRRSTSRSNSASSSSLTSWRSAR